MPGVLEPNRALNWIQSDKSLACKEKTKPLAADSGGDGRRVTGLVVCSFPQDFAGALVKGHNAGAIWSANVQQDRTAFHQRGASHSKKPLRSLKVGFDIHTPDLFSAVQVEPIEHPFGSKRVNASADSS